MQVSAVQGPTVPPPVTPVPRVTPGRDNDGDNDKGGPEKIKAANPPGVGTRVDIQA